MKKQLIFLAFVVALIGIPFQASAAENPANYFVIKGGLYSPSESYELDDFNDGKTSELDSETGFNGEIAIGHYFLPVFAIELGAGYFESEGSPEAEPGETKLKVVPVLATAKVFLPIGPVELYGGFGIGAYFTKIDVNENDGDLSGDSEVTYGLHAGAGVNANITDTVFVGVEVRYLWAKPSYGGHDVALDGFTTTVDLGLRF